MNRPRQENKFTLIEMVAAMAIMVFIALIIATASMTFYNGWRRSVRHSDALKERLAIDRVMDSCVKAMIPFEWRDEDQQKNRVIFQGEPDEMRFTALRRSYRGDHGALIFVRLRLEENSLIAEYSPYPRPHWLEESDDLPFTREVIARNIKSLSFLYADEVNGELEWDDSWDDEDDDTLQQDTLRISTSASAANARTFDIPAAVQMTLEWMDGTTEVWLRRSAGTAKNTQYVP